MLGFAFLITILSIIDLVIGTSLAARNHYDLAKRFIGLEKNMITTKNPSDDDVTAFIAMRLEIEADEPPPLRVLSVICHNEMKRAMGYDEETFIKIKRYQRLFCNFFDINEHCLTLPKTNT